MEDADLAEEEEAETSLVPDTAEEKMKENDLLEGISEEELDVSDEDKDQKVKIADALGVDWSQLITTKESKDSVQMNNSGSFRHQWSPAAIFSRIGLPKNLLRPGQFEEVIEKVNSQGQGRLEILDHNPAIHCFLIEQKDKPKGHAMCKGALSSRSDLKFRQKLLGLTKMY